MNINDKIKNSDNQPIDVSELSMPESYEYIGAQHILKNVKLEYIGTIIHHKNDIDQWMIKTKQSIPRNKILVATYVIDIKGQFRIADRHSEHVQCAFKENVLSAGEVGFEIIKNKVSDITFISNQSTGYCPSPHSWKYVEQSLSQVEGLNVPDGFDPVFEFSYCTNCETLKIIKEDWYFCYKCGDELFTDSEFQKRRAYLKIN